MKSDNNEEEGVKKGNLVARKPSLNTSESDSGKPSPHTNFVQETTLLSVRKISKDESSDEENTQSSNESSKDGGDSEEAKSNEENED